MEDSGASQYTAYETMAEGWSQDLIYAGLSQYYWQDESPLIAAAGLDDISILRLLLHKAESLDEDSRWDVINLEHEHWVLNTQKWPTPLLRAIERQRPENVRLLLEHGADPDGISDETQMHLARLDRRFWLSDKLYDVGFFLYGGGTIKAEDVGTVPQEYIPLTDDELTTRRSKIACFWKEPHKLDLDYSSDEMLLNSVVRAGTATPAILDQLLESGADASAWLAPGVADQLPDEEHLTSSTLARSTPFHAAIASKNMWMLQALLERGFNPNARALITGSCALTPAQYAIVLGNLEAYAILEASDRLDKSVVTPVFGVHILHFATAQLRVELLDAANVPISSAPVTALGHTLLHVACMPYQESEVQTSEKVEQSIHDIRGLRMAQYVGNSSATAEYDSFGRKVDWYPQYEQRPPVPYPVTRDMSDELPRQEEVCKLIISALGPEQIGITDCHGNTALHYLAGSWFLNESLISWMRTYPEGELVWNDVENMWGHTPQALWDDNQLERVVASPSTCVRRCIEGHCVRRRLGGQGGGRCTYGRGLP